jgi:antitoxin component of MazEF toxin-antitoxin module
MGYRVKLQKVERPTNKSYYLNFPAAIAEALGAEKGEEFEWEIEDKNTLVLRRVAPLPPRKSGSSKKSRRVDSAACSQLRSGALGENLRQSPEDLHSPDWHAAELRETEDRLERGEEKFLDCDAVRDTLNFYSGSHISLIQKQHKRRT